MNGRWFHQYKRLGGPLLSLMVILAIGVPRSGAYYQQQERGRSAGTELPPAAPLDHTFPNCRFGITASGGEMLQFDIISKLNAGWHLDFGSVLSDPGPAEAEYARMVRVHQDRTGTGECGPDYGYWVNPPLTAGGLGAKVDANPGALWIVGNEPDRIGQADTCPQQYAEAYHDVHHYIKGRDPTAQVAVAGLVEVTPGRMQYLDIVWDSYISKYGTTMPVDVWTMHIYVLSETGEGDAHIALGTDPDLAIPFNFNCAISGSFCHAEHDDVDLFIEQVVRMREWMEQHGEQNRPLVLSEYSLLKPYHYPTQQNPSGTCSVETCTGPPEDWEFCFCDENAETFHPTRVANFMHATFNYLMTATNPALGYPVDGPRLVQQWMWYSLATQEVYGVAHASNLVDPNAAYTLTLQGQRWQDHVTAIAPAVNLLPVRVPTGYGHAGNGIVALRAEVMNNGNTTVSGPVTVTFYSDAGLNTEIGSPVLTDLGGCGRRVARVTTTWGNLGVGTHSFWVKVDSTEDIAETDETDNVMQGTAIVMPFGVHLPLVQRGTE